MSYDNLGITKFDKSMVDAFGNTKQVPFNLSHTNNANILGEKRKSIDCKKFTINSASPR